MMYFMGYVVVRTEKRYSGLKVYLSEAETFASTRAASGNWEEQRARDNISNLVYFISLRCKG